MIKKSYLFFVLITIFILLFNNLSYANNKLPLPRFASIKSNKANARKGPGKDCPIEWIFIKKGEPVEIINEFEEWREVKDVEGICGWVHLSVLSGKRSAIIIGKDVVYLRKKSDDSSKIIAKLVPGLRCELKKTTPTHCKIKCNKLDGWVMKNLIWGVYKNEEL